MCKNSTGEESNEAHISAWKQQQFFTYDILNPPASYLNVHILRDNVFRTTT